jgi:hydrogenase maturation protease
VGEGGGYSVLVIGVGNPDRGDDGAGPQVAAMLRRRGVNAIEHLGDGLALIDLWENQSAVVIIDATVSGVAPGTIRRLDTAAGPLPREAFAVSSHAFGLAEAVETARALGRLPANVVVYGIEGESFTLGAGLTGRVEKACARVAQDILSESFQPQEA